MNRERAFSLMDTEYPAVRRVMGPDRERLDDDALEHLLGDLFPGALAEDVEDFMRSVQSFARQVAPVAQRALPGVIQGAVQGGTIAGPWGALAGAIGGGVSGALARPPAAPGVPPPAPSAPGPAPLAAPPAAAGPAAPPAGASAAAATAQLVALLSRPETLQALQALLMAGAGRSTVQVGGRQVPAAAFANAIAETAALAADASGHPLEQSASEYLFDSLGQPRGDVVNPSERAALLLSDLMAVAAQEALAEEEEDAEDEGWSEAWEADDADEGDPLDGYEGAIGGYLP